ncbi:hypothetical protein BDZ91DRAFT_712041 [Kalaharituber pfeilii]|nr:hypothetical protein BDZ91DRAFT_712041 [Kalaharituber pfeilii]
MPEPGFQHKIGNIANINPFDEEPPSRLSPYAVAEIATLQSRLDKQLGPEYISSRPGAGGVKVHYLAADKVINLANEVFGFNGWSSSIRNIQIDFVEENSGKVNLGLSVIMRVTLKDGTYHEDIGYGHIENCKGKAAAFEKAKKEGTTDALKRALRNFGNVLGNCVYDKNYIKEVTKIRIPATRFNPANLHRHSDFAPRNVSSNDERNSTSILKTEGVKFEEAKTEADKSMDGDLTGASDDYGGDEFDEEFGVFVEGDESTLDGLMPDEVIIEPSNSTPTNTTAPPAAFNNSRPSFPPGATTGNSEDSPLINRRPPNAPNNPQTPTPKPMQQQQQYQKLPPPNFQQRPPAPRPAMQQPPRGQTMGPPQQRPQQSSHQPPQNNPPRSNTPTNSIPALPAPQLNTPHNSSNQQNPPVEFFSARAAKSLQSDAIPAEAPVFNPHHQTSIPRSVGIDHSKSSPVPRKLLGNQGVGASGLANTAPKLDFTNPSGFNGARQIGMPPSAGPQLNRTPYKPPSTVGLPQAYQGGAGIKRPADNSGPGIGQNYRPALNDASNTMLNAQGQTQFNGNDPKRMRS